MAAVGSRGAVRGALGGALARRAAPAARRSVAVRAAEEPSTEEESVVTAPPAGPKSTGPEPKKFTVADGQLAEVAAASLPLVMRGGVGIMVSGWSASVVKDEGQSGYSLASFGGNRLQETSKIPTFARPEKPLQLYEFEGCPFCKKVREAVSVLDLDVEVYPCPKDGKSWRPKATELGGKAMFPYLVDPNTGTAMYESDDIIAYLFEKYGDSEVPALLKLGVLTTITAGLGQLPRAGKGSAARAAKAPEQPLVLWGYEGSPFVKLAREQLCELELPYLLKTCARGSATRDEMLDKFGHFQVPFLEDPNTGESMWESSYIVSYLDKTYAA